MERIGNYTIEIFLPANFQTRVHWVLKAITQKMSLHELMLPKQGLDPYIMTLCLIISLSALKLYLIEGNFLIN